MNDDQVIPKEYLSTFFPKAGIVAPAIMLDIRELVDLDDDGIVPKELYVDSNLFSGVYALTDYCGDYGHMYFQKTFMN